MLFELRNSVPPVSPPWVEARDVFLEGRSRRAWELAQALRRTPCLDQPNDYVLNIEIARACSAHRTYLALVRRAVAAFPEDPYVQLYHARSLLTRNRHVAGIEYLHGCESTLGRTHRALWGTELANVYGNTGFEASCRKWPDAVQGEPGMDSPLALYTRACAHEGLRRWDDAVQLARRCVEAAPDWSRARTYLAHCLLARGEVEAAEAEFREAERRGHEEAVLDIAVAMLTLSLGRFDEARTRLDAALDRWPQADFRSWARRMLCVLLVEMGNVEEARRVAGGREEQMALPEIPAAASGRRRMLPLPMVAQSKNQCVPTSVAMAAWPQGRKLDPDALFRQMRGRDGTTLWRMRRWAQENGFHLVPVVLKREAIVELLDQNMPLVGPLEGAFSGHVDVLCGYCDDLDVLYVRDPQHWALVAWPWQLALSRYEPYGGVLAVIDAAQEAVRAVAERWRSGVCEALLDVAEAVATGNVAAAEAAYARVPDDSPPACLRDMHAVNVVISPSRFHQRMQAIAASEDAHLVARFRAMTALGSDDVEELLDRRLDREPQQQFGVGVRRYLRLRKRMGEGRWQDARRLIDQLLLTGGGVAEFWELKSDVLAELGDHQSSREALERAIELEPHRVSLREKALNRAASRLTFAQYLEEFNALLAQDPDDKRLLIGRAAAMLDGPDGRAYQQAASDALRWFPRAPNTYADLLAWYRTQRREDLAQDLLAKARTMLPEEFPPEPEPSAEPERESAEAEAAPAPLPEDKDGLLAVAADPTDSRRPTALARLMDLERAGQLAWHQRARLLACRLLIPDDPEGGEVDPAAVLPAHAPGAAHWFAQRVCDLVTDGDPSIRVALALNDWLDRVVPDVTNYPDVWFQRVLLLEHGGQMERALEELRRFLDRYPATSSALYRMGVVKYRQEDFPAAKEHLERALAVNPGLAGAMEMLRRVHDVLDDPSGALEATKMLRRKFPYAIEFLRDEVLTVAERESIQAAEAILDEAAADFPPRHLGVLRAFACLVAQRVDDAARLLAEIHVSDEDDEELFEEYLQVAMAIAEHHDDTPRILELCQRGLRRWPDSTRLKEIQAERLAPSEPQRSRQLLAEVLCQGEPQAQTATQYLMVVQEKPDQAARQLIQSAPADRRQALAELFAQVMTHHSLVHRNIPLLEWAVETFPEADMLRWRLAMHYNIGGKVRQAVKLAEELHQRHPEDPEATRLLGRCLIDQSPKKALPYLEAACQQNRSADYLFDLARCHQLAGNRDTARQLYWETLQQNPYSSCSWTNLYLLRASPKRLWPYLPPMLQRGRGVDDEYFLVAAVRVAVDQRQPLPEAWYPLAAQRYAVLRTYPGFQDERRQLHRALLAWRWKRPADARGAPKVPRPLLASLAARFLWPRCAWVPTGESRPPGRAEPGAPANHGAGEASPGPGGPGGNRPGSVQ